jgi:fused signal recognition particle receptor
MEELKKVKRVVTKIDSTAPHEVLLVIDATTGQNGLTQAKYFTEAVGVTGIILAKLDGTAKGGIVLAICDELKIPVKYIGVGEKLDDLAAFDAGAFVEALFD